MCGRTACSLGAARLRRACAYRDRRGRRQQPEWLREERYRPSYNKGPQSCGPVLLSRKHVQQVNGGASAGARPPGGGGGLHPIGVLGRRVGFGVGCWVVLAACFASQVSLLVNIAVALRRAASRAVLPLSAVSLWQSVTSVGSSPGSLKLYCGLCSALRVPTALRWGRAGNKISSPEQHSAGITVSLSPNSPKQGALSRDT